jgi:hypothetical protein
MYIWHRLQQLKSNLYQVMFTALVRQILKAMSSRIEVDTDLLETHRICF